MWSNNHTHSSSMAGDEAVVGSYSDALSRSVEVSVSARDKEKPFFLFCA
jgi:hypothetical protein